MQSVTNKQMDWYRHKQAQNMNKLTKTVNLRTAGKRERTRGWCVNVGF